MKSWQMFRRARRQSAEQGMSMIELLIAMTVLAVGVSGILAMVLLAMAANSRSKNDSTATMLAQLVIEQVQSQPSNSTATLTVTDCSGANRFIRVGAAPAPNGAGAQVTNGQINWGQAEAAVPIGYQMQFITCGPADRRITYDVRWNVTTQFTGASGAFTKIVTVSARPRAMQFAGADGLKWFAFPVQLRTVVGM